MFCPSQFETMSNCKKKNSNLDSLKKLTFNEIHQQNLYQPLNTKKKKQNGSNWNRQRSPDTTNLTKILNINCILTSCNAATHTPRIFLLIAQSDSSNEVISFVRYFDWWDSFIYRIFTEISTSSLFTVCMVVKKHSVALLVSGNMAARGRGQTNKEMDHSPRNN